MGRWWRSLAIVLAVAAAQVASFPALFGLAGVVPGIGPTLLAPVVAAGWLFGVRAGLAAALAMAVIGALELNLVGAPGWAVLFERGGGPGLVLCLLLGLGCGWIRDLLERVRRQDDELTRQHAALREQIGARARAEARLAGQSAQLALHEAAALNLADGLVLCDMDGRVVFWNPRLEELYGVRARDAVGRPMIEMTRQVAARATDPEATLRRALAARDEALAGRPSAFAYRLEGDPARDLEVLAFRVDGPDGRLGLGRLVRDVTRDRETGRLLDHLLAVADRAEVPPAAVG
ncbi:MAG TPA: PAS domain-containing protein [Chloroflexota bacterium]|nr:PAS domain-containing protein [Chloroflexota bacterium]